MQSVFHYPDSFLTSKEWYIFQVSQSYNLSRSTAIFLQYSLQYCSLTHLQKSLTSCHVLGNNINSKTGRTCDAERCFESVQAMLKTFNRSQNFLKYLIISSLHHHEDYNIVVIQFLIKLHNLECCLYLILLQMSAGLLSLVWIMSMKSSAASSLPALTLLEPVPCNKNPFVCVRVCVSCLSGFGSSAWRRACGFSGFRWTQDAAAEGTPHRHPRQGHVGTLCKWPEWLTEAQIRNKERRKHPQKWLLRTQDGQNRHH